MPTTAGGTTTGRSTKSSTALRFPAGATANHQLFEAGRLQHGGAITFLDELEEVVEPAPFGVDRVLDLAQRFGRGDPVLDALLEDTDLLLSPRLFETSLH